MAYPTLIALMGDPTTWTPPATGYLNIGVNLSGQIVSQQPNGTFTTLSGSPLISPQPGINGITATSNSLDKIVTAGNAVLLGTVYILSLTVGGLIGGQIWQLISGPGASDGVTTQRPLDFNPSTNNVGWIRLI